MDYHQGGYLNDHNINQSPHHSDFASKYSKVGESYEEFAIRLEKELNTPQKVEFYSSYLEKVGFKP